ncbi:hypothetical protein VE02_10099 [Pseudogymnoascus sp. 03VT05]|nr:hypothetical protein VE02_10099 [Pseudogymnoascus sp. 03VT05]
MSDRRVKWEENEKLQLKRLFRSHPIKPVSYLQNLFNEGKPKHQHRSYNAVKSRVRPLKKEWHQRWLEETSEWTYRFANEEGIVSTAPTSSSTSLFDNKYAWSAGYGDLHFTPSLVEE